MHDDSCVSDPASSFKIHKNHETGSRVTDKEQRSHNLRNKERAGVRDNEYGGIVEQKRRDNGTEYR